MPLKHRTETALLFLLAGVIAVTGWLVALLPHSPLGLFYWIALLVPAIAYPLALRGFFRANRADREFRLMHWFPLGMLALWIILEFFAPRFTAALILQLGFFFLWSLPLVFLGILFLILFAMHVLRRSRERVIVLSAALGLFTIFSVVAEAGDWNVGAQRAVYRPTAIGSVLDPAYDVIVGQGNPYFSSSAVAVFPESSSSTSRSAVSLSSSKPSSLPQSWPGEYGAIALALLGIYSAVLHRRALVRVATVASL